MPVDRWLAVGLLFVATACKSVADCRSHPGRDVAVPDKVKVKMRQEGLEGYALVDRVSCRDTVYWTAIPPGMSASVPRPPGFGLLVSLDMNSQVVSVDGEQ